MVDEQQGLTWDLATRLLDANFHFRSSAQGSNAQRSYRTSPNSPELRIWSEGKSFIIELPTPISAFHKEVTKPKTIGSFRYEITTAEQLLKGIATLKEVVRSDIQLQANDGIHDPIQGVKMQVPLNSILYGPPGTGKTYKTAQLAVEICDAEAPRDRDRLMTRYEELRKQGRISFVTFHQSYGYEDFVEGLRPETNEGFVTYQVRPGLFKDICDAARRSTLVKPGLHGKPLKDRTIFKMSLGEAGTAEGKQVFQTCIQHEILLLGWGGNVDFGDCGNQDEILKRAKESESLEKSESHARYIGVFKEEVQRGDIVIVSHGNSSFQAIGEITGEYEFLEVPLAGHFHQKRAVRWLAVYEGKHPVGEIFDRKFMMSSLYKLDPTGVKFDVLENLLKSEQSSTNLPFVLVIDEINRANISKVFGELITLLERDKREGQVNALTVRLPYSGDAFCIPSNLYVVGTMNTADRSIALLDTALRRRFEFEELQPNYDVLPEENIDGVNLRLLLQAINERIEYLYDRNHTIGHAYFIDVHSLSDLEIVFRRKVIPLLQEYFYENWSKVRAVLNDVAGAFIETQEKIPRGLERIVDVYDAKPRHRVNNMPFTQNAFLNIYQDA